MILFPLLLLLFTAALHVNAAPWSNTSHYGNCSAEYPSLLVPISTTSVTVPLGNTTQFIVQHNATNDVRGDCLVQFSIPAGSYGCQLELFFSAGFQNLPNSDSDGQIDFWTIDRVINSEDDWSEAPGGATLFGIAFLHEGASRVVINSCKCKSILSFRVSMTSNAGVGNVSFVQILKGGLKMTHSC